MRCRLWVGWIIDGVRHELEIVVPPVIILGIHNASALYDAMDGQRFHQSFLTFFRRLVSWSRVGLVDYELDGDFINLKYMAFQEQETYPPETGILIWAFKCWKHGNNHNIHQVSEAADDHISEVYDSGSLIAAVRCLSRWLQMGNNYLRLSGWRSRCSDVPSRFRICRCPFGAIIAIF